MTFAQPQFLYGLFLIPLLMLFLIWSSYRRRVAIARLGDPLLVAKLSADVNWRGRRWQLALWLLAAALLTFALARPQWGSEVQVVERQGVQIMVALDISKSMLAEDIKPNRLSRAKLEISDLMSRLDGDDVGLVLFSGASFIQFPLTSDYATARSFLVSANPDVISRPGTAIGDAIKMSLRGFDERLGSQKVIIIMTDGEDQETDPIGAAQQATTEDAIIYTVGFGSAQGEPIPQYDTQGNLIDYIKDQNGEVVLSRLDESTLQEIASITNGNYYRASSGDAIESLLNDLGNLEQTRSQSAFETLQVERFQMFLLAALLALFAAELIPDRVRNKDRGALA